MAGCTRVICSRISSDVMTIMGFQADRLKHHSSGSRITLPSYSLQLGRCKMFFPWNPPDRHSTHHLEELYLSSGRLDLMFMTRWLMQAPHQPTKSSLLDSKRIGRSPRCVLTGDSKASDCVALGDSKSQ